MSSGNPVHECSKNFLTSLILLFGKVKIFVLASILQTILSTFSGELFAVNNVGVSFNYPEIIHQVEDGLQKLADVDIVNTLPTTVVSL